MTATVVKRLAPTQVELEIPIAPEELAAAEDRAFRDLAKNARIPGFRPGKVPRKIFEAQYGSGIIVERAMDAVVPQVYSRALRENDLEPVDQPQVELMPVEDGQPLRLRATVAVRPEIELRDYKGVPLPPMSTEVTDEQLEGALEALRRDAAVLEPVERPVQLGDVATVDYAGTIDGVPFEGGSAEGQPMEVLEERFIPGFASGIVGMSAGDERDVEATFPETYAKTDLAGKTAVFHVKVHDVKVAALPDLDDEFAKRFGPDATVEQLRADVRARLEASARDRVRRDQGGAVMDAIVASHPVSLPAIMVEREIDSLIEETRTYVARAGISWEDYLTQSDKSEADFRETYRPEAERRVKATLLLEAIAKAEGIQATQADIEAEIAALGRQYGQSREAVLQMLERNLGALVDGIVRSKTVDFLIEHSRPGEAPAPATAEPVEATVTTQT